jgi:hypothetical protein
MINIYIYILLKKYNQNKTYKYDLLKNDLIKYDGCRNNYKVDQTYIYLSYAVIVVKKKLNLYILFTWSNEKEYIYNIWSNLYLLYNIITEKLIRQIFYSIIFDPFFSTIFLCPLNFQFQFYKTKFPESVQQR